MKKTTFSGGFIAVGLLVVVIFGVQSGSAQTFGFQVAGFTTTNVCNNNVTPPPGCQVLTDGSPSQPMVITGGILRLTTANQNQHGAAWYYLTQPLSTGFTTAFQFQISSTNSCFFCSFPADGLALVIQNDPAGTGAIGYTGNGQNMAYGNNDVSTASGPGNAIKNSLAIELDTHLNSNYSDPDGNHIALQSCGPNNATTLSANSADHNYACPDGNLAKLALQSLPSGMSLSDGKTHTITVNYLPPGTCTSGCNNLSVYLDSTLILQATVDMTKQLNLTSNGGAYIGFTAATGSSVENNDIISWSFSSLPLAPITINQPLQPTQTNFNYTTDLTAVTDYSQSGLNGNSFQGVVMQGTVQSITDQQFSDLVNNTPFQGSTCQHQDTGSGNFNCVTTTDLCTTPTNGNPSGANCPNTGTNALILVNNSYNLDPSQKPVIAPGYIMGKDTALGCGASGNNTCKGLVNIFTGMNGDLVTTGGKTNNFNSILIPILGVVQPTTSPTTTPALTNGWTNGSVALNFNSIETVPGNNHNPPSSLPTVSNITYSVTGANPPNPAFGTLPGSSGTITIPGSVEGTTVVAFFATDSSGTVETTVTNDTGKNTVSSATPTITIQVDKTAPTANCVGPNPPPNGWQASDVLYNCSASDNAGGSGLANSNQSIFTLSTNVPAGTETASATIPQVTIFDVAGNSTTQGPFGPFEVDKKAPTISGPTISPASPTYGQSVIANYSCADGGSEVVLCGPPGSSTITATANTGALSSSVDSSVGSHSVTINSQDAVGNQSAPSMVAYTVVQATPTVTFTGAPASAALGSTFTVSATTNASTTAVITAAGACSIVANLVTMNGGTGVCSLTATWAADKNYVAATASQSTSAIKGTTITTITSVSPNPAAPNQPVLVTLSVVGSTNVVAPTGTVTVTASTGENCSTTTSNGRCTLTFLTGGQRTVSASYGGDSNFGSSSTTTSVLVTVGDFSISATPSSQTIPSGHQASYTITLTPINGLTGAVNLSCSGAPPNSTCSVSPSVDNLQGKPISSTVTLSANKNVNHGTFTLTFTGNYGNGVLVHSASVSLTVK